MAEAKRAGQIDGPPAAWPVLRLDVVTASRLFRQARGPTWESSRWETFLTGDV
jgi:hypothetical protein